MVQENRLGGTSAVHNVEDLSSEHSVSPFPGGDEHGRLLEALRRSRDRFELFSRTVSRLLTSPEPQKVIEELCNEVRLFLDCAVFFNFLVDPQARRLRLNACGGVDRRLARKVERLELTESLCGSSAQAGCRVVAEKVLTSADPRAGLVRSLGVRAYACHPLLGANGEAFGTLSFGAGNRDAFSPDDLDLMRTVAHHVAAALLRQRAEEGLRESEERLRLAKEAGRIGIHDYNPVTGELHWDERLRELWGLGSDDSVNYEVFMAGVHPEDRAATDAAVQRAMDPAGDGECYVEYRLVRDGRVQWIAATGQATFDAGRAVRLVGTVQDITERRRAEEALKASERLYRAIGESINYGIWVCDPQGRNTYASESFLKLVGMTQRECSEFGWGNVLHPEDAEATIAAWKECARTGQSWYWEHRYRGVDGQWHPILACGVPVRDERGDITCWAGINLDISQLKRTEEELRKAKDELAGANANLERLVAERTAKLQELVGELEHFSYTITHDLKSPLRAMRGFAEMASMACEEHGIKEAIEFLGRISSAAERMDRLIADALNYSRTVRQELPLEDVDVGALLRGMLDSYPELQPDRARIRVESPLPEVLANQAGLTQAFSNLLGNAVKFVKPGTKPDIRVWATHNEGWVRVWVEDQGIGIPKDMLPRVFEMFSRASRNYEGTGIGLALVRKVAQRMGGKVGVESEEGKGSRFWIELRASQAKAEGSRSAVPTGAAGRKGAVLYVEDEDCDVLFMERAFARQGLAGRLRLVGDGRSAIEYLSGAGKYGDRERYPLPDLVLLDLNLPQVPGFAVLEWMRNHPDYKFTPVIIFSSSTREDDRARAKELRANDFVSKPSSGLEFAVVVDELKRKWLGKKENRDAGLS
ncbi:MAG: PAS domain S-box protein [Verrucomicrobiia bacterium]